MKNYSKYRYYSLLFITELFVLLFFSQSTSPLYPNSYGHDSAFFILVGFGMKNGLLPYRDFFDMKGPVLFLIEYCGQLLIEGRAGAFLMQLINLSVLLLIFNRTIDLIKKQKNSSKFLLNVLCMFVYASCIEGGNLTEEYSLIPLSVTLYLCLDYFLVNGDSHAPINAFIYGCSFAAIALIRITNAALICACVFSIAVTLIAKKAFKNLIYNAIAFIGGFL